MYMKSVPLLAWLAFLFILLLEACEKENLSFVAPSEQEAQSELASYFGFAGNVVSEVEFEAASIKPNRSDLGVVSPAPEGLFSVNYKGAIDPNEAPWYEGWSFYDNIVQGKLESEPIPELPVEIVTDRNGAGTGTATWTNDRIWVLTEPVYINKGDILTIEPGTIIQGRDGSGENASALVVVPGAQIIAEGTKEQPIIFTYEGDTGNTPTDVRGKWGGLILLGNATINTDLGISPIEGLLESNIRAYYGGNNDTDNSGILRYVSIRHGGMVLRKDNEINGLTLGGVGSGTTIEYVEVISNVDDGIEWFGGTVGLNNVISAYNRDDAIDYDTGYRGKNQFMIVHQDENAGDRGGEHDGGINPANTPFAVPVFYNITSIGNPNGQVAIFRDNAGGEYHNSIFLDYGEGIEIELSQEENFHSYRQFKEGNLKIENNIFSNIQSGNLPINLLKISYQ